MNFFVFGCMAMTDSVSDCIVRGWHCDMVPTVTWGSRLPVSPGFSCRLR